MMLLAGMISIAGCGGKEEPVPSTPAPVQETKPAVPATERKPVDLATAKPDFTLDPKAWYTEWTANDRAARDKYEGKVVELSGEVSEVTARLEGDRIARGVVIIKAVGKDHTIRCLTTDLHPWERVSAGSKVKMRGVVPPFAEFPMLGPSIIVEASPNPAIVISALQLTKEYDDEPKKTVERYKDKYLIVEGEILQKKTDALGITMAFLKGAEDAPPVVCKFPHAMRTEAAALKGGQKIKVVGLFAGWAAADQALELTQSFLFK
jgi:hypothetical protein